MNIKTWQERLDDMIYIDDQGYEESKDECKLAEINELRAEVERLAGSVLGLNRYLATVQSEKLKR